MKHINTQTPVEYIFNSLLWTSVITFAYTRLLLCPLPNHGFSRSVQFYLWLLLGCTALGFLLTFDKRRNTMSLFINAVGSHLIYFTLSYWNTLNTPLRITLALALGASVAYLLLVLAVYLRENAPVSLMRCLSAGLLSARTVFVTVFSLFFLFTLTKSVVGLPLLASDAAIAQEAVKTETEGETITKNIETVLLLQDEAWDELEAQERLSVMQTIADIEANYLGIPVVPVSSSNLSPGTRGCYTYPDNIIQLDLQLLTNGTSREVLKTLLHEVYHAYQHRLVELYDALTPQHRELLLFSAAQAYKEEFSSYINGTEDYRGYAAQRCESDSNTHAEEGVEDYFRRIDLYLAEQAAQ